MNQENISDDTTNDMDGIEELNLAWDSWNARSTPRESNGEDLSDLFAKLNAVDDAPAPDAAFLAALRANLLKPMPILSTTPIHKSSLGLVALPTMPAPFPWLTPIRLAYAGIAAALLIVALVGGDRWLPGSGSAVMVASAMASPASHNEPTATTHPDSSARIRRPTSPSLDQTGTDLMIDPTVIPYSQENTTFGGTNLRVVRTPAIVYSIE
jgi:hypothetical protein